MVILYLKSGHEIQQWGRILKTSCLGKAGDRETADDSGRVWGFSQQTSLCLLQGGISQSAQQQCSRHKNSTRCTRSTHPRKSVRGCGNPLEGGVEVWNTCRRSRGRKGIKEMMCYLTGCEGKKRRVREGEMPREGLHQHRRGHQGEELLHGEPTMTLVSDKLSLRSHSRRGQGLMELTNGWDYTRVKEECLFSSKLRFYVHADP